MQAIIETLFDVCYLVSVITIGIRMVKSSKNNRQFKLFGWMAIVLGAGDSFHLIPRMIALCMMPQNNWLSADAPLSWGIYRNIPFAVIGLITIVLFYTSAKQNNDTAFKWMWMTIVLSFGFYIPVVLWANTIPMIGMLMIPKTCAYVWTVIIGYNAMKKELN